LIDLGFLSSNPNIVEQRPNNIRQILAAILVIYSVHKWSDLKKEILDQKLILEVMSKKPRKTYFNVMQSKPLYTWKNRLE